MKYSFVVGAKAGVSRSRSFQLTLRESIRHLRKRGSTIETKEQPKPKPDEKADDVAKPDEEGKVKEGGKPEGSEKVEETKKPEETAGAGVGSEAATAQPEVVGVTPQDGGASAGQPDLIAENKPSEAENKPSEAEEPKVEEKKPEETKPEATQGAAGDVAATESAGLVSSVSFSKRVSGFKCLRKRKTF